jgi:hypothetical protein
MAYAQLGSQVLVRSGLLRTACSPTLTRVCGHNRNVPVYVSIALCAFVSHGSVLVLVRNWQVSVAPGCLRRAT